MLTKPATNAEIQAALYRQSGKKRQNLESQILKGCLEWLNTVPGCRVWRQNVGGRVWVDSDGKTRHVAFGAPGMADLSGVGPHGVRIEIEIKKPGEEPSEAQNDWLDLMKTHGAIAFWVDSIDDCVRYMGRHFRARQWEWKKEWEV